MSSNKKEASSNEESNDDSGKSDFDVFDSIRSLFGETICEALLSKF